MTYPQGPSSTAPEAEDNQSAVQDFVAETGRLKAQLKELASRPINAYDTLTMTQIANLNKTIQEREKTLEQWQRQNRSTNVDDLSSELEGMAVSQQGLIPEGRPFSIGLLRGQQNPTQNQQPLPYSQSGQTWLPAAYGAYGQQGASGSQYQTGDPTYGPNPPYTVPQQTEPYMPFGYQGGAQVAPQFGGNQPAQYGGPQDQYGQPYQQGPYQQGQPFGGNQQNRRGNGPG